jgi:hypothetical protein
MEVSSQRQALGSLPVGEAPVPSELAVVWFSEPVWMMYMIYRRENSLNPVGF